MNTYIEPTLGKDHSLNQHSHSDSLCLSEQARMVRESGGKLRTACWIDVGIFACGEDCSFPLPRLLICGLLLLFVVVRAGA